MKLITTASLLVLTMMFCSDASAKSKAAAAPQVLSIEKIWDAGKHNAFTDLIRFKNKWFCTFREGDHHVGGDGVIRVLTSKDGKVWDSAAVLEEKGVDLRDPKLSITPDNRLMLVMGGSLYEGKTLKGRQPRVAFSTNGSDWTTPQRVASEGDWLWRVTWNDKNKKAYGLAYTTAKGTDDWKLKLLESKDGTSFDVLQELDIPGKPNEATLRFTKKGDAIALVRREGIDRQAWIGTSKAPYTNWTWKASGMQIGGPNFIQLPNGTLVASGRQYNPAPTGPKTFIGRMNLETVIPQIILPSGGDCSYPGMVMHNGVLWVSYYSSHEGKTSIYLAKAKWPQK